MKNLCKFLVRISIIFISLYFIIVYGIALAYRVNFHNDIYVALLELCLAVFVSVQGNYHCKYARYTAWGIFLSDTITRLDYAFNFIPVSNTAIVSSLILGIGISTSVFLAIRHFILVQILKRKKKSRYREYGIKR